MAKPKQNHPEWMKNKKAEEDGRPIIDGKRRDRVISPRPNQVVYYASGRGEPKLVCIVEGRYMGEFDRISNFWYWRPVNEDGTLGKKRGGYGRFYKCNRRYRVETKIIFS